SRLGENVRAPRRVGDAAIPQDGDQRRGSQRACRVSIEEVAMSSHEPPIRTGLLAIVTGLMFTIGPSMVDLSLPALPLIQQSIGTSALRAELSLTVVFLGLALAQLIFGAFADRWGRRRPLLIGMAGYCCAALAAAFAPDMVTFLIARLIQAVCYGVAIVLARSAVVDISDERST